MRGRNGQAPDGYEDDVAVHAAWIADMFQDGEPGTQPHGLQGSSAPPAAERGATGEQHNGGAAASAGGHCGNAASAANGVPGAEIPGITAEALGIMMRAFSQAASSSEGRERNVNVKLAKMPTHGDRTLPCIKAWTQWYDVRLKSWAGAQTPGFVEAIERYVKIYPDERAIVQYQKDNRLLAYELCAMVD